ncbi:MAG: SufD family Fe-S cluster assembly protein, partial [Gammaproteobacteria bacterium]|nr:SufD family Fe-S cluster assembly protein [Gammaproteobacteria bacterium]
MSANAAEHFTALFATSRDQLPGAGDASVAALRDQAIATLSETGLPSKRSEAWRYTDVSALAGIEFATRQQLAPLDADLAALRSRYTLDDALVLAFVDGVFDADASSIDALPEGLHVAPLDTTTADAALRPPGQRDPAAAREPFTALNTAFTTTGAIISVDSNASIQAPLQIVHVATRADEAVMANPRLEISMAPGSALELVEVFLGAGDTANFNNCVTEITLADSARLQHLKVQQEADAAWHIAATRVRQDAGSSYAVQSIAIGGGTARQDIAIGLNGPAAEASLAGLYLADGRRHTDHRLLIDHAAIETVSDQNFKGILNDRARGVFNGKVIVQQDAQRIRADQS